MSHEYTERDSMFTVRQPSWHRLETAVLDDYPTVAEAKKIAHDWEPVQEPLYRRVPTVAEDGTLGHHYEEVEGWRHNVRSDDAFSLGVVTDTYTPVLNAELYDLAEGLESAARGNLPVKIETAGSLKGGRKVWLLLRLEEPLPTPGDPTGGTIPYYALQNAHDGSGAFRGQATMTRIVCDNTAQLADFEATKRGTSIVLRHTASVTERLEQAKLALAGWREGLAHWSELVDDLLKVKISPEGREAFIEQFIPEPVTDRLISQRVRTNIEKARSEMRGIFNGPTQDYINGTAYGLVQGAIEWSQHYKGTRAKDRRGRAENLFQRAYLDDNLLAREAQKLALTAANY